MTTDEIVKVCDSLIEAFKHVGDSMKELAKSIEKYYGSLNRCFTITRKHYPELNLRKSYTFERKLPKHLPYQRRNY